MIRHAPEIRHVVQAAAVGREVRDVAALASHRPELMDRLHMQNIAFPRSETSQPQRPKNHSHLTLMSSIDVVSASRALLTIFRIND